MDPTNRRRSRYSVNYFFGLCGLALTKVFRDGEPFPVEYKEMLLGVWNDPPVKQAYERGNEAALPEKSVPSFPSLQIVGLNPYA
jgi:hypothetical protein